MCSAWETLLQKAAEDKERKFGRDAAAAMRYFRANAEEIWADENIYTGKKSAVGFISPPTGMGQNIVAPSFRVCIAKTAQCVHLFGPQFVPDNPIRVLTPRLRKEPRQEFFGEGEEAMLLFQQKMQEIQMRNMVTEEITRVVQDYQNYTSGELDLAEQSGKVINEAIIKGMGVWWHERYRPTEDSPWMIGSFYDTVDNLLLDPDERENIKDCKWFARRCIKPYWEVEDEFDQPRGSLKKYCTMESRQQQAWIDGNWDAKDKRQRGKTNDLLPYFKIWTKMGVGDYLADVDESLRGRFPNFPKHCYLVIVPGCSYPLNMPKDKFDEAVLSYNKQDIIDAFQWPVPFYMDGRMPFTHLQFHSQPNCIWPVAHIKFGLGLLNFLNWCMGYLASKIRTSCQTHVAAISGLPKEFKQALFSGNEMVLLELSETLGKSVTDVVSFLQAPRMNGDIWKIIEWALQEFDKAVGLTEVLYGMSNTQDRSATETKLKNQNATTRVDYMRRQVQASMRHLARSEAIMARMLLDGKRDIAPILGADDGMIWDRYVATQDVEHIFREIDYDIEPDDGPRPNRQQKLQSLMEIGSQAVPFMGQLALANPMDERFITPWNRHFSAICKLLGMPEDEWPLIPPPPPPDPNAPPSPEEQQLMMEQQKMQADMAIEQAKLQFQVEGKKADMAIASQKAQLDASVKMQGMQLDAASKKQDMELKVLAESLKIRGEQQKQQLQASGQAQQVQWKGQESKQKLVFDALAGAQKLQQQKREGEQKIKLSAMTGAVQTIAAVQKADAAKATKPPPKRKKKKE